MVVMKHDSNLITYETDLLVKNGIEVGRTYNDIYDVIAINQINEKYFVVYEYVGLHNRSIMTIEDFIQLCASKKSV